MATSAVSFLLNELSTLIKKEVVLLWGVEKDMGELSSTLSTILDVLDDAEMKQHQDKPLENWLRKLKDAAYVVRDILDACETEALKWEIKFESSGRLKKVWTSAITCYPVVNLCFRHHIGNRMKAIIKKLNAISEERKRFHLNEGFIGKGLKLADDSLETCAALPLEVFGRQDDIEKIVKVLTKDVRDLEEFSVYPIFGIGGLGKTTVAQMTINDERIRSHFVLKIWVYVSQNFELRQVMKQIIESASGDACKLSSLDPLRKEVIKILSGKRFLLVLDDAWSENQEDWDKLKPALACGLPGSCVVVTTRIEKVALITGTLPTHYLSSLSPDDCWSLFRQRAFGPGNEERPELVDIGKEIVKKCSGVPLAAKALGGMMRFTGGEEEWQNIADSNLWDIPEEKCSILPALRLSYYNLPLELRHCFSLCAVFLKGSKMKKEKLIHLWMANGFISSKGKIEVEDVGNQIWNELYKRSFFQDEEKDSKGEVYFRMHDLMHDLSQFVTGDECQMMVCVSSSSVLTQRIRHATLIGNMQQGNIPEALKEQSSLHSIILHHVYSECVTFDYPWGIKNMGSLRVIDVNGYLLTEFSGPVGSSKHLRYLNLSGSHIRKLPSSICELPNLQTLNLNGCFNLMMLPKKMNNLRGLRHLYMLGCTALKDTPAKLGKLAQLKTLSLFVVGESCGQRLGELQHLYLGGELTIMRLDRVRDSIEAKEANLAGKPNLRIIRLSWEFSVEDTVEEQEKQQRVVEALVPHPNVQELTIKDYRGQELPQWMGNPSVLLRLKSLAINRCPQLTITLPELPALESLTIEDCSISVNVLNSISRFTSLTNLELEGSWDVVCFPDDMFKMLTRLQTLRIRGFEKLKTLPESVSSRIALKELFISGCDELESLPEGVIGSLRSLVQMHIGNCPKLASLPYSIQKLTQLQILRLWFCSPELERRYNSENGTDWPMVAHIPLLDI